MKTAFWGLGIIILGILGIVLTNLFGNITVTNQLNYTTMKNAVEASMIDALDMSYYRTGFCLCTDKEKSSKTNITTFTDQNQYELLDITYKDGKETCNSKKKCEILHGEYRLNKKAFSESIIRRFAEIVNNNKDYELVIQEIIEYPPKVSVRINSEDDNFLPTDKESGGFTIVNQMDSIVEAWNGIPTPMPAPKIKCDNKTWTGKKLKIATCSGGVFTMVNSKFIDDAEVIERTNIGKYEVKCENEDSEATKTCKINPTPAPANNGGSSGGGGSGNDCTWHHNTIKVSCTKGYGKKTETVLAEYGYSSCAAAKKACSDKASAACGAGWTASYSCEGYQNRSVTCQNTSGSKRFRAWANSCSNSTTCSKICGSDSIVSCKCSG